MLPLRSNQSAAHARHRGNYTSRACFACQQKKKKCEVVFDVELGARRDCERCVAANIECSWVGKKTRPVFNASVVKRLKDRIKSLETKLEDCTCQLRKKKDVDDVDDSVVSMSSTASASDDTWIDTSASLPEAPPDDTSIDQLLVPTTHLVLNDETDYLQQWGPCSIFRLAPSRSTNPSRFPDIMKSSDQTYVLQVDGVDPAKCKHNFDWSRHLPSEVFMDRREHDKLLDLLFKFFTSWCLQIVPPLFLRDMHRALSIPDSHPLPRMSHYSPMLHNALLALAMSFSDDPRMRDLSTRLFFVRKAKGYIDAECQRPSIGVMHAFSTLSSFHIAQGDQTLGYVYFGMSSQISQALGLNIDCSPWVKASRISYDDMLDRNWAYWTCFSQDVCLSFYAGRRGVIPLPDHSNLPIPFVDSEYDKIPWHYPPSSVPPQPNYLSHTFAETCEVLKIARQIMNFLQGLRTFNYDREVHEIINDIDDRLSTWKECLSIEVDITPLNLADALPHRLMLHLTYWWLYILLHRPFYRQGPVVGSSESSIDHARICNNAAAKIMELLETWRSLYTLRFVPIALMQVVFSTGTIFLLASKLSPSPESEDVTSTVTHSGSPASLCLEYLNEISLSWNCANGIREILEHWLWRSEGASQQGSGQNQREAPTVSRPSVPSGPERPTQIPTPMDIFPSYEGYPHLPSAPHQSLPFATPFDPQLNYDFDLGGQPYSVDQFMDAFGGDNSYGIDHMGAAQGDLGPGNGMPDGHALANHPINQFNLGVGEPTLLASRNSQRRQDH